MLYVADSNEQARRDFEQPVLWWYRAISRYVAPPKGSEAVQGYETFTKIRDLAAAVDFNSLVEGGGVIAGDPDYVCRRIEEVEREYGFTDLLVWTRMGGLDSGKVMRSM